MAAGLNWLGSGECADGIANELDADDKAQDGHDHGIVLGHPVFSLVSNSWDRVPIAK